MKNVSLIIITALFCASIFSGCSKLLEKEYLSINPHLEQREENPDENWLEADNFAGLKNAIIHLVRTGAAHGTIRCYGNYSGDLSRDLPGAIYEVMKKEPIGAYSVEYIPYEAPVHFPSYYEMNISITYSKNAEQISSVKGINGLDDFKSELLSSMLEFKNNLALEISYYEDSTYDVKKIVEEIYYENPGVAFGLPKTTVDFYPDTGFSRILDITLNYPEDKTAINSKKEQLNLAAKQVSAETNNFSQFDKTVHFYEYLRSNASYDNEGAKELRDKGDAYQKTSSSTAYGALNEKRAMPEGYALAFKLLCDLSDLDCVVVSGRYENLQYYWNIVKIGDGYYHVDVSRNICLYSDSKMPSAYRWDQDKYPGCNSAEYSYPPVVTTQASDNGGGKSTLAPSESAAAENSR